jgi:hypothetical protein
MTNTFPGEDQIRQATEKASTPKLTSPKKQSNPNKAALKKSVSKGADSKETQKPNRNQRKIKN